MPEVLTGTGNSLCVDSSWHRQGPHVRRHCHSPLRRHLPCKATRADSAGYRALLPRRPPSQPVAQSASTAGWVEVGGKKNGTGYQHRLRPPAFPVQAVNEPARTAEF
jgi:hypothetical protein